MQLKAGTEKVPACKLTGIQKQKCRDVFTVFKKAWHWYMVPLTVLFIGILSIVMISSLHFIIRDQRDYSIIVDSIMGIQINASIYHLGIEEAVSGDMEWDKKRSEAAIDQAIVLADELLNYDAQAGSDTISLQSRPREFHDRINEIKSLLTDIRQLGLHRLEHKAKSVPGSASDSQFDGFFAGILDKAGSLQQLFQSKRERNRVKLWNLFLGIYVAWTFVMIVATTALWKLEMRRKRAEESLREANEQLSSQAEELAVHRENLEGLVSQRTIELTVANEKLRDEIMVRTLAERRLQESEIQIRQCSFRLIDAQETERKRISTELHDGLGQALNVMKLRLRLIEKGFGDISEAARLECEHLLDYLNEVIDDVRRLSLDLSPAILEDLGLTQALRWLARNFRESSGMEVISEIGDIDGLFPTSEYISIYRVIQEALTNVGKHAEATKITIVIERCDGDVNFSVEDDGKGFRPEAVMNKDGSTKGLGLATMRERIQIIGGEFKLRSWVGEGTKISFTIPVADKGA